MHLPSRNIHSPDSVDDCPTRIREGVFDLSGTRGFDDGCSSAGSQPGRCVTALPLRGPSALPGRAQAANDGGYVDEEVPWRSSKRQ